jgi:hypothetical protein
MKLLSKLRAPWFFGAFIVGLVLAYVLGAKPEVIVKFPSPKNAGSVVYHGDESCFKYNAEKVACPTDESEVRPQPIQ